MSAVRIEDRPRVECVGQGRRRAWGESVPCQAVAEIPRPFCVSGNCRNKRIALAQPRALVVAEDKGTILLDWPAQECAELITLEWLLALIEIVDCIQFVVADKFVGSAVDLVGSGFQDDVYGSATAAELGAHGILLGAKLLNRMGRR